MSRRWFASSVPTPRRIAPARPTTSTGGGWWNGRRCEAVGRSDGVLAVCRAKRVAFGPRPAGCRTADREPRALDAGSRIDDDPAPLHGTGAAEEDHDGDRVDRSFDAEVCHPRGPTGGGG